MSAPGLIIAAPSSGAGKTTLTLGLLRAFADRGIAVQPFKNGPDYIDPVFHRAASGRESVNLDNWAMSRGQISALIAAGQPADLIVAEGSMGLFDGVALPGETGNGSGADLAALTGWPVLLVLDVSAQAQSAAAVARGFATLNPDVTIAGVVLNRVASPRHEALTRPAIEAQGLPVLGALPRTKGLEVPERHLGLVQAVEHPQLDALLEDAAARVSQHCDLDRIRELARLGRIKESHGGPNIGIPVPGERIALAQDAAFSFVYPHMIAGWRAAGATILPFSPLADEPPDPSATACWLPGGYPELHAPRLAAATRFREALRDFARTRPVHGECGGYMALGQALVDADGTSHAMTGLLGLRTSFAKRRLHLGYRHARLHAPMPGLDAGIALRGHEFHYATILDQPDAALAEVHDAGGLPVAETGSWRAGAEGGMITGSFFHLIAKASQ